MEHTATIPLNRNRTGTCKKCGKCCYFMIEVRFPLTHEKFLEGFGFEYQDRRFIKKIKCKYLKDNLCQRWEEAPIHCRTFPRYAEDSWYRRVKHICGFRFMGYNKR